MSPSKRKPARKAKAAAKRPGRSGKRPAKATKKSAPRRTSRAGRSPAAPTPPAPRPWTAEITDLNLAWYTVTDWERAKRFYGETLGFPVAFSDEQVGWIEYGRALPHLAISRGNPSSLPSSSGGAIAVLTCPDVRATVAKLQARGVRCGEVQEIPGMVILGTIYDPDGNKLQLAQSLAS